MRLALGLLATIAGAIVLLQELLAAGWIAPLHGSGIDVWATVLAISLLALAVGAGIGSRTARSRRVLVPPVVVLAVAGVLLAGGALVVARSEATEPLSLAAVSVLLLGLPLALLGMLSPWLVERYAATGRGAGRAAGIVYAVGTMGSAAGALLGGLVLVPRLGLRDTTFLAGLALPLGGFLAALVAGRSRRVAALAAAVALLLLGGMRQWGASDASQEGSFGLRRVERVDGWYGRHEVLEDDVARYLLVDGILQTSALRYDVGAAQPGDLLRAGNALELAVWLRPRAGRALVIGLGGGAFPGRLESAGWDVEAVEIDPVVVDLARRYFAVPPEIPVHLEDGRRFLQRTRERFALLVLDVYRGEHLPGHLFTEEAFARMRECLEPGGLLAMNLIGASVGDDVLAVVRAVRSAFPHVVLVAPDGGRTLGPMTLFAAVTPVEDPSSRDRAAAVGVDWPATASLDTLPWEEASSLTDDRNPLPLLRRDTATLWRARSLRRFALTLASDPD